MQYVHPTHVTCEAEGVGSGRVLSREAWSSLSCPAYDWRYFLTQKSVMEAPRSRLVNEHAHTTDIPTSGAEDDARDTLEVRRSLLGMQCTPQ